MTHALTIPCTPISTITRSSLASSKPNKGSNLPCLDLHSTSLPCQRAPVNAPVSRRNALGLSIGGLILGLNAVIEKNAWAGARRPPPTPSGEKTDPNVSGVLAKVLASKKRKEAMKEAIAKQRERGKKVEE